MARIDNPQPENMWPASNEPMKTVSGSEMKLWLNDIIIKNKKYKPWIIFCGFIFCAPTYLFIFITYWSMADNDSNEWTFDVSNKQPLITESTNYQPTSTELNAKFFRSSRPEVFCKDGVFLQNSQENACVGVSF